MHGTILITQPDPCSCALCRINGLYEFYDNLARIQAPPIPKDRARSRDIELYWEAVRRAGKRFWRLKDQMK